MIFPLATHEVFGYEAGLVLGTVIGFAFGFVLERAGFGRAPVLAAQFYFVDTRVLKVMFSAIVTALLGTTLLSGLGLLDLSQVSVPATFLGPQVAGGLLLGAGFIISGYCPGTAVVGIGSGKLDAILTILGVCAGALVFGAAYPLVAGFYASGSMGVVRLPDLLSIPAPLLALGVTVMAVGAFLGAEILERRTAAKNGTEPPPGSRVVRNRVFVFMGAIAAVTLATLFAPSGKVAAPVVAPRAIEPVALAQILVERPESLLVLDLRPAAQCAQKRIPKATCLPEKDAGAAFLSELVPSRTLVVYGERDLGTFPAGVREYKGEVLALRGGYDAFVRDVLTPPPPPVPSLPETVESYKLRAALSAYFTGTAAKAPPPSSAPARPAAKRPAKHGGGC